MHNTERLSVEQFVRGLRSIPHEQFKQDRVLRYMSDSQLELEDLERYTSWKDGGYARNLIYKNDLFEVLALCWDIGQESPIHNHSGQLGWAMIQKGTLSITNYRLAGCDALYADGSQPDVCAANCHARVEEVSRIAVAGVGAIAKVNERLTIHKISNLRSFGERAVSLHVYSFPYDSCIIYDTDSEICRRVQLGYDTTPLEPLFAS